MSRSASLIFLGVLVILAPFSGLPFSWLEVFIPIFGLVVLLIGLSIRLEHVRDSKAAVESVAPSVAPPESVQPTQINF